MTARAGCLSLSAARASLAHTEAVERCLSNAASLPLMAAMSPSAAGHARVLALRVERVLCRGVEAYSAAHLASSVFVIIILIMHRGHALKTSLHIC
jgi:hypothetical protein